MVQVSTKKTLLFIPGLICDAELWRNQINAFKDEYNILVADHSQSDDFETLAQLIINDVPDRFHLIGLSMGGYLAQEIIRRVPERVEKLALMATSSRLDPDTIRKTRIGLVQLASKGRFVGMSRQMLGTFVHESKLDDPSVADVVYAMAKKTGSESFIKQQKAILSRPHLQPFLKDISVKTLIICGDSDPRTPVEYHQEIADGIPHADWHILENCGHLPPLEQPEKVNHLMKQWLTND